VLEKDHKDTQSARVMRHPKNGNPEGRKRNPALKDGRKSVA